MSDTFEVECPDCHTILIVNKRTGKVLEVRRPLLDEAERTGDRFEDARKKVHDSSRRLEEKVEAAKAAQKDKLARLDSLFKERKKEIEETGEPIARPDDPFRD